MPYGSVGGMEKLAYTFYMHYRQLGYQVKAVKIIGLPNDIIHFGEDEIVLSHQDFADYSSLQRLFFYAKVPLMLRKIIKQYKIDYTISFGDMANCFSALTFTKEFKIASLHAVKSIEFQNLSGINRFFKWSMDHTYQHFRKVVCISQAIKDDLVSHCGYQYANLEVIYNPHDINYITEQAEKDVMTPEEEQLFQGKTILFLGRLGLQKAPWHLVNAFKIAEEELNAFKLVFVGDGTPEVEQLLKKQVNDLGLEERVVFLGRKSNPYPYLKKATLLALCSYYEGTPNVIAEAIILDTPVVSTNSTAGVGEMMIYDSTTEENQLVTTAAGIITPNMLDAEVAMPQNLDFIDGESIFAEALKRIGLLTQPWSNPAREAMLEKYDTAHVLRAYLP